MARAHLALALYAERDTSTRKRQPRQHVKLGVGAATDVLDSPTVQSGYSPEQLPEFRSESLLERETDKPWVVHVLFSVHDNVNLAHFVNGIQLIFLLRS